MSWIKKSQKEEIGKSPHHMFFSLERAKAYGFWTYLDISDNAFSVTEFIPFDDLKGGSKLLPKDAIYLGVTDGRKDRAVATPLKNREEKIKPKINSREIEDFDYYFHNK